MLPFSTIYPHIVKEGFSGAAPPVLDFAIVQAARNFCKSTNIIRVTLPVINIIAGTSVYVPMDTQQLDGSYFRDVYAIDSCVYTDSNGSMVQLKPSSILEQYQSDDLWMMRTGVPQNYIFDGFNLTLSPSPDSTVVGGKLTIIGIMIPNPDCTALDDILLTRFHDGMSSGACLELLDITGPWQALEPKRGKFTSEFEASQMEATINRLTRNSGKAIRVRYPRS